MRSLSELEKVRGEWPFDSSSDRLLMKRRSEVDEVDTSKTPSPTISEIAQSPDGHQFFTDLCQDPSPKARHDSDTDSKPASSQTLSHCDFISVCTIKIRT